MRRILRFGAPLLAFVLAGPLSLAQGARAQLEGVGDKAKERIKGSGGDAPDENAADEGGSSGDSADSGDNTADTPEAGFGGDAPKGKKGKKGEEEASAAAPEQYTVQPGDTLWGLSQRFLNNPWYRPKIWSYNQGLDNPNWIRPGTVLRFYPGEGPVEVERPQQDDEPDFENIDEGGGFEVGNGLTNRSEIGNDTRRREFFIPADRIEDAGQIVNSPEEKRLLASDDKTYVKLKKGSPGDVFQIFRKERELRHPVTGANLGLIVSQVGEVRIDQTGKEQALGTIVSAWDPIERGYYVANLPVRSDAVKRQANGKNVKGYVVDAAPNPLSFLGESYIAVVDKGSQDGVQVGNTFTIVRAGDPYTKEYSGMADEDIGEVIVIEVFKNASTGLLLSASRVIVPGDRIEMRTK